MRNLLVIVSLALLLLSGAAGLLAVGQRLAWEQAPPPKAAPSYSQPFPLGTPEIG